MTPQPFIILASPVLSDIVFLYTIIMMIAVMITKIINMYVYSIYVHIDLNIYIYAILN